MKDKILYTKDILKLEIAEELGFSEKIRQAGWGGIDVCRIGQSGRDIESVYAPKKMDLGKYY